jgi:hypothetical protein
MFREQRLLSQHLESGPRTGEGGFREMFSSLAGRSRGLFDRLLGRDRDALRSTAETFGREFNQVRSSLVDQVRREVPQLRSATTLGAGFGNTRDGMSWDPQSRRLTTPGRAAFRTGTEQDDGSHTFGVDVDDDGITSLIGVDDDGNADLVDIHGEDSAAFPRETNTFRFDTSGMTRILEDFRKESAEHAQQREKIFSGVLAKLEELQKSIEADEKASGDQAANNKAAVEQGQKKQAADTQAGTPPAATEQASKDQAARTEFPTTAESMRERFRYSAERFGTPEGYARFLAEQLTTDERWNRFLQAMFEYDESRSGTPARVINLNNAADNDAWVHPLTFMTTYNARGRMHGDCEDLSFFVTHIARLQGKQAFSMGLASDIAERRPDTTFRLKAEGGHVFTGWFEPGTDGRRIAKLVTTRGILDSNRTQVGQAGLFSMQANAGETDAQLLTRLLNQVASVTDANAVPAAVRTLDASAVQSMHVLTNGNGYAIYGNLSLLLRQNELEGFLGRTPPDYRNVARVVREELARDQNNIGLHSSLIQFLLLADDRSEVNAAVTALVTTLRTQQPVSRNVRAVHAAREMLLGAGFNDPQTQELDRFVKTWLETNIRPTT